MPTSWRPNDGIEVTGISSIPCSTSDMSFGEHLSDPGIVDREKLDRTNDLRERLGPLIQRLKKSVLNIQTLEDSMMSKNRESDVGGEYDMEGEEKQNMGRQHILSMAKSRELMDKSMEMVKNKMLRLKNMEEELSAFEDRRVNLHHYMQQQVALKFIESQSEMATVNLEYQNRITELEHEILRMKEKSVSLDEFSAQKNRLLEKTKDVKRLESELAVEKSLRNKLKSNLQEHKHKMKQEAVHYDNLECKVEVLTSTIENLTKVLQTQENSKLSLDYNVMETIPLDRDYCSSVISSQETILTEPMTLSWSESSISNDASAVGNEVSNSIEELDALKSEITDESMLQTLEEKVGSLNRENAELRASKNYALKKCKSLSEKIEVQASMIEDLRQKLDRTVLKGIQQS